MGALRLMPVALAHSLGDLGERRQAHAGVFAAFVIVRTSGQQAMGRLLGAARSQLVEVRHG
jgi:hypothetical protein